MASQLGAKAESVMAGIGGSGRKWKTNRENKDIHLRRNWKGTNGEGDSGEVGDGRRNGVLVEARCPGVEGRAVSPHRGHGNKGQVVQWG